MRSTLGLHGFAWTLTHVAIFPICFLNGSITDLTGTGQTVSPFDRITDSQREDHEK